jgi:DNA (cytosine-5)-methyltransferase 1
MVDSIMRRKDGKPKQKSKRTKPEFTFAFRDHPDTLKYKHPCCVGSRNANNWKVASLFSGCGGLDLSFLGGFDYLGKRYQKLPFDVVDAIDNLPDAVECYRLNLGNHCREADLTTLPVDQILPADILIGGFPCQDFSSSGPKTGFSGHRGQLYRVLAEYMAQYQPKVVVAENVPYLARLHNGKYLQTILDDFEAEGYHFDMWELYGPDYGLSQSRRRIFLVGVRNDLPGFPVMPKTIHKNAHIPIAAALADLEDVTDEKVTNQSQYFISTRASSGGGQGDHKNKADKVAYCIRANSRGRIQFHHHLDRRLTVRECARLQSFPDQFVFPFTTQRNLTLIGNAVPPILGYRVAQSIQKYLSSVAVYDTQYSENTMSQMVGLQMTRTHALQPELF